MASVPDYSIIGRRIKEARMERKISQEELAEKMEISVSFISRWETGRAKINLKRLIEISKILEVTTDFLISGSETETRNYLSREFNDILEKCNSNQQKFIYRIAELVTQMNI